MFRITTLVPVLLFDGDEGAGAGASATAQQGSGDAAQQGQAQQGTGNADGQQQTEAQQQQQRDPVPYDRFREVNDQRTAAEEERDRLQAELTRREREGLPELERVRAELGDERVARQTAEQRATEAEQRATNLERAGWVQAAASNFHDPADAVARVDLSTIDSQAAAERAVEDLAGRAQHLVRPPANQTVTGGDMLQQILDRGRLSDGQAQNEETKVIPAAQFNALTADQLVALQEKQPDVYERSLRAAAQA